MVDPDEDSVELESREFRIRPRPPGGRLVSSGTLNFYGVKMENPGFRR